MTEQENKAIKWMKNVRDDEVATLDHIAKEEPNVSPMLYAGRKEKAETIIKGFEELEQYRVIGTVSELQDLVIGINALADSQFSAADMAKLVNDMKSLYEYRQIGTPKECRASMEKQKPHKWERGIENDVRCPFCGTMTTKTYEHRYCSSCGHGLE